MRPITDSEQEILKLLLSMEFEGAAVFRTQAMHILGVESDCICGCPSIKIHVDRAKAAPALGIRILPTQLEELSRADGVPSSVLCLLDRDGYLANLECVYYDEVVTDWPASNRSAIVLRDSARNVSAVLLPSGVLVNPHKEGDSWISFRKEKLGFTATTRSGWTETYDAAGRLVSRASGR